MYPKNSGGGECTLHHKKTQDQANRQTSAVTFALILTFCNSKKKKKNGDTSLVLTVVLKFEV